MNANDDIRHRILAYFYDRNSNATSRTGKRGSAVKISDVKKDLKERESFKQQQVMSNLTYLIDNGWVKTFDIEKTVTVRGGTVPSATSYYEIAAKGIDKIEGGSRFEPTERYPGININASGANVITLGDGNVVRAEYNDTRIALDELKEAISGCDDLADEEKLDLSVDLESIMDQLAKASPNRSVIRSLWAGLERVATLSGVGSAFSKAAALLEPLVS